jgi:hypothetical protein
MSPARACIALAIVPLLLAACDAEVASSPNTAHVTGTVGSKNLTPRSAVARYGDVTTSAMSGSSASARGVILLLSDKPNSCEATHTRGATAIAVSIPGAQLNPGTYAIVDVTQKSASNGGAAATFDAEDQSCTSTVAQNATGGRVTITEIFSTLGAGGGTRIRGSFTLGFPGGDVTGDFDAVLCNDGGDAGGASMAEPVIGDAGRAAGPCTP